jgi:hypothetical protein
MLELVRAGVGVPDLPVRIDGVARWRATADVARTFRHERVFLAGDAAHLMPPNGGFGGNTGIHDAHNLAWKIAAVLNGAAGEALLESYDRERRPVGKFTVEQAFSRYVTRTAPWLASSQAIEPVVHDFHVEIGYLYSSAAVVSEGGESAGHADPREAAGRPGSRMPHVWLTRAGERLSTLDLIRGFLLLSGPRGGEWIRAARHVARARPGLTLDAYCIGADLDETDRAFAPAFGISDSGASLIRPDGFVAWRAGERHQHPDAELRSVLDRVLAGP